MSPQNNLNLYYLSHTDRNSESVSEGLKLHIGVVAGLVGSLRHQAPSSFIGSCCILDPSIHRLRIFTLVGILLLILRPLEGHVLKAGLQTGFRHLNSGTQGAWQ